MPAYASPTRHRDFFPVEVLPDRDRVILAPVGDLDLATADDVWEQFEALRARGFERIVLDLAGSIACST